MTTSLKEFMSFKDVGIPYHQKIYFDRFLQYDDYENNAYMTVVAKGTPTKEDFEKLILPDCRNQDKIYVTYSAFKSMDHQLKSLEKVELINSHMEDFQRRFNHYVYLHKGYIDPHPRLFHESYHYGKRISYFNENEVHDGGFFRYLDLMDNGLVNKTFTKDDEITVEASKFKSVSVVHLCLPFVNGGLFDALDYHYWLKDIFSGATDTRIMLVMSDLCSYVRTPEQMTQSITQAIKNKYRGTEEELMEGVQFISSPIMLAKTKSDCIIVLDNHTFPRIYPFTKRHTKSYLITVDPYVPSNVPYRELETMDSVKVFNEMRLWRERD